MSLTLSAWALALMLAKAPPERLSALPAYPGWEEPTEQRTARYVDIAEAAATVGKTRATTALLLAVSFHESGFAPDVDRGPCYRGLDGKSTRCDSGRAKCLMQVRTDAHLEWNGEDLFASHEACFRAGLALLRRSQRACVALGPDFAFDGYAGGSCLGTVAKTHQRGLELIMLARRFASWEPTLSIQ